MAVRRQKVHGTSVWIARVQINGRRVSRVCASREAARAADAELLQKLRQQISKEAEQAARPATLREAFEGYVEGLAARGKSPDSISRAAQTARVVEGVMPVVLDSPISEFCEAHIFRFRRARVEAKIKPSTINRDLRTLRALLRRVRPEFRFAQGVFFSEDETRVRWLRPEEEITVLEPMRSPFREMAKLATLTLMRQGEIRLLRREHVHLEQGVVLLPRAKAGARAVVLNQAAQEILRNQLANHSNEWVFPARHGGPYTRGPVGRAFRKASRRAGLRDFHFHDLRHHGATMALNAGYSASIVMALGGWKTERMMRRYAAVTDETLRRAAEAVSGNAVTTPRHEQVDLVRSAASRPTF